MKTLSSVVLALLMLFAEFSVIVAVLVAPWALFRRRRLRSRLTRV